MLVFYQKGKEVRIGNEGTKAGCVKELEEEKE